MLINVGKVITDLEKKKKLEKNLIFIHNFVLIRQIKIITSNTKPTQNNKINDAT